MEELLTPLSIFRVKFATIIQSQISSFTVPISVVLFFIKFYMCHPNLVKLPRTFWVR